MLSIYKKQEFIAWKINISGQDRGGNIQQSPCKYTIVRTLRCQVHLCYELTQPLLQQTHFWRFMQRSLISNKSFPLAFLGLLPFPPLLSQLVFVTNQDVYTWEKEPQLRNISIRLACTQVYYIYYSYCVGNFFKDLSYLLIIVDSV